MKFEDQLRALVYFHLEEHVSAQHLLQVLEQDEFAREFIAPEGGIKKSSFAEANSHRALNSFCMYIRIFRRRRAIFCRAATRSLANWSPLTGH